MSVRRIVLHAMAKGDLRDIWRLIDERDGEERAERVYARIEAFCRSLEDVPPDLSPVSHPIMGRVPG